VTDLDLLEKYEPVLRFAKSERFFPMAVEPYLEKRILFPSGPGGVAELVTHLNIPLQERIGKLHSEQYFLLLAGRPDPLSVLVFQPKPEGAPDCVEGDPVEADEFPGGGRFYLSAR
jgi:hypothetical protein